MVAGALVDLVSSDDRMRIIIYLLMMILNLLQDRASTYAKHTFGACGCVEFIAPFAALLSAFSLFRSRYDRK
jgi:hypothetical protein